MFNVLLTFQDLQSVNWEALITSIVGTVSIQGLVMYALVKVLQKIGLKSEKTEEYASKIGASVEDLVMGQKTANQTLKDVKDVTVEMVKNDAELQKLYTQASGIVMQKIELITQLKETIDNFIKED